VRAIGPLDQGLAFLALDAVDGPFADQERVVEWAAGGARITEPNSAILYPSDSVHGIAVKSHVLGTVGTKVDRLIGHHLSRWRSSGPDQDGQAARLAEPRIVPS
jgi:hypothetical protein